MKTFFDTTNVHVLMVGIMKYFRCTQQVLIHTNCVLKPSVSLFDFTFSLFSLITSPMYSSSLKSRTARSLCFSFSTPTPCCAEIGRISSNVRSFSGLISSGTDSTDSGNKSPKHKFSRKRKLEKQV